MPDDPQVVEDLVKEVSIKEERREGKRKRDMVDNDIPRSGIDYKLQPEEIVPAEEEVSDKINP